jgi:hypothetical protein
MPIDYGWMCHKAQNQLRVNNIVDLVTLKKIYRAIHAS